MYSKEEENICDELRRMTNMMSKKFVRYKEGAERYSMGLHSFIDIAKEAGATYHVKSMVLVNTEILDEYLENFRDEQ